MAEKHRVELQIRAKKLEKVDALIEMGKYSTRSDFFRQAAARELESVQRKIARSKIPGKGKITWRDLDDAALDGLAELAKRVKKKRGK